jgi:predicted outer membrane repeat protein
MAISGGLIAQNFAESNGGGIVSGSALELSGTKIIGNIAKELGGGVYSTGGLDIADSIVSKNVATLGGGIFQQSPAELTLIRSKVVDNISVDGEQIADL